MTNTPGPGEPDPGRPQPEQPGYWQQPGYAPGAPMPYAPEHPRATTSLVLGILAIVLCQVLGPFAWKIGRDTVREIDASGGRWGGRGPAQAGYVLGVVATVLLGLAVLYLLFLLVVVVGMGAFTFIERS